ncbi:MAG: hypothetical protein NTV33_10885 [Coprothermobacterota bacterium]|nr:hypothetical protein [Coprothermobacterota bacterium]
MKCDQDKDGIDHINVYSQGKTELGKMLSNFYRLPVDIDGITFQSLEGYWYWLSTGKVYGELLNLYGYRAKERGKQLPKVLMSEGEFHCAILRAMLAKVEQHENLAKMLKESALPLTHYYVFNGKEVDAGCSWVLSGWETIRKNLNNGVNLKPPVGVQENFDGHLPTDLVKLGGISLSTPNISNLENGIYTSSKLCTCGPDSMDITRGGANSVFAPSWNILKNFKAKAISANQYKKLYWEEMASSWSVDKSPFKTLVAKAAQHPVVLVCYCSTGQFCHRILLAKEILARRLGCKYLGEIGIVQWVICPHCAFHLPTVLLQKLRKEHQIQRCPSCGGMLAAKP